MKTLFFIIACGFLLTPQLVQAASPQEMTLIRDCIIAEGHEVLPPGGNIVQGFELELRCNNLSYVLFYMYMPGRDEMLTITRTSADGQSRVMQDIGLDGRVDAAFEKNWWGGAAAENIFDAKGYADMRPIGIHLLKYWHVQYRTAVDDICQCLDERER